MSTRGHHRSRSKRKLKGTKKRNARDEERLEAEASSPESPPEESE